MVHADEGRHKNGRASGANGAHGGAKNGAGSAETGQVPIRLIPVADLRHPPENDTLYRPITPHDPDIQDLAANIRANAGNGPGGTGILHPLIITLDNFILSGNRRCVAAKVAGLREVPCQVEAVRHGDPGFLLLLVAANKQRVKSLDEVVREEVVSANPEDAYRRLREHRRKLAAVEGELNVIEIEGTKRRARITAAKTPMLEAVLQVLRDYRDYWPLTDRQIHYFLLNDPPLKHASKPDSRYQNDRLSYKNLCDLLFRARVAGIIDWSVIEDPTRSVVTWDCHPSPTSFIREGLGDLLKGYYRDLQQTQPNHLEIIGEKNTVRNIIKPVAAEFCVSFTLGRGYCSAPPRKAMLQRYLRSGKEKLIILALSDFDPEGSDIAHSFARSMRDDFGVKNIVPMQVGLTHEQALAWGLPPQMKAKAKSSRRKKFVARHGETVHELEAVPPEQLQEVLRQQIESALDLEAFNREVEAEKKDAAYLEGVRRRVLAALAEFVLPEEGSRDGHQE